MQRPGFGEVAVQRALSFYRAPDFYDYIYKLVYNYIEKTRYLSTLNSRELVSHINAIKFESFFGSSFFNELKSSIYQVTSINNKIEKIDKQCKIIRMQNELYNADTFLSKQQYIECNYNNSGVVSLFPSGNIFSCYLPIYKRHLWEPFISPDAAIHLVLKIERANLSERCVRATEEVRKSSSIKRMLSEIIRYWRTERGDFRNLAKLDIKFFNRK